MSILFLNILTLLHNQLIMCSIHLLFFVKMRIFLNNKAWCSWLEQNTAISAASSVAFQRSRVDGHVSGASLALPGRHYCAARLGPSRVAASQSCRALRRRRRAFVPVEYIRSLLIIHSTLLRRLRPVSRCRPKLVSLTRMSTR